MKGFVAVESVMNQCIYCTVHLEIILVKPFCLLFCLAPHGNLFKDHYGCCYIYNPDSGFVFFLQGAPGNRGFPGQDGLAGPKVSISSQQIH